MAIRDALGRFVSTSRAHSAQAADMPRIARTGVPRTVLSEQTTSTTSEHLRSQRAQIAYAMVALGKPVFGGVLGGQRLAASRRHAARKTANASRRANRP